MKIHHIISSLIAAGAVAAVATPAAMAATVSTQEAVSENWSGYVAGSPAGSGQFSAVSGSWVQPAAKCSASDAYSAFWVGLGGAGNGSQALEQVGTQSDCLNGGQTQYYAWYELVPAAPVKLALTINPGDHVSAHVAVSGTNVTVSLSDQTSGQSSTKTLQMSQPDASSAEWIAEAPSTCDGTGNCQPLPLADFGTVNFTGASATADGHTGTISDSDWTAQSVALSSASNQIGYVGDGTDTGGSSAGAQPSSLSTDGSSFSVAWQASSATSVGSQGAGNPDGQNPGTQGGGYGNGPGGDGGYGYSGGGYGYGYGGGGYGYGGDGGYGYSGGGGYGYGPGGYGAGSVSYYGYGY